jgi:uncharacterized protein involved in outer membrane biogenesis
MRRAVLWILGVAGGVTALILVVVAVVIATVDVRSLVGPLQARVKAETGRDLVFGGPIDLKVSLEPKLIAHDVALANASWSASTPMVRAKRVEVQVALLPLLQKRFDVVEVALVEPVIALETDAKGRANWDFSAPNVAPAPASAPVAPPAAPAAAATVIAVGNIAIRNGTLTYRDGATAKTTRVAIERLAMRSRENGAPIEAEFRGTVDDVTVALSGHLGPLDALRGGLWPYPIAVKGDVDGKPASVSTKLTINGETTALDALDVVFGTLALKGELRITRQGGRTRYDFALSAPTWSLRDAALAGAAATGGVSMQKAAPPSRFLISDRPLPLDALKGADLGGTLAVGELVIDARHPLRAVTLTVNNARGKLDVPAFQASGYGGVLSGRASVDATDANAPAIQLRINGRDLDLGALLAAMGEPRQVRGGKTAVTVDVAARGNSLHAWAASATGQALVTVGPATLVNTRLDVDDVLDRLSGSVNPWRERDPSTELLCAVIRLPLANGIAHVDRSIAMETKKLGVSASGTLDLRDERVDFVLRPRVREGIPLDIPNMAELVHFTGPLAHPEVKIDPARSIETIAKVGAALSTGGLSLLGTSLLAKVADGGDPCEIALGRQAAAGKPVAAADRESKTPAAIPKEIGKALGRLFGR